MKCEKCKDEIQEGVIFGNLMVKSFAQAGKSFNDIIIEKGWRLPTLQEGINLVNDEQFVKWSKFSDEKNDFYVQQPFKKNEGKRAAWFGCYVGYFVLFAGDGLVSTNPARGVFLVKNLKQRGKE